MRRCFCLVVCSAIKVDVSCIGADRLPYFSRGSEAEFAENEQQQIHSPDGTTQRLPADATRDIGPRLSLTQHLQQQYGHRPIVWSQ